MSHQMMIFPGVTRPHLPRTAHVLVGRMSDTTSTAGPTGTPLRVGLIGYGLAGSVFHAPLIAATDALTLGTVVTANPERQAQALAEHPGVRPVASADELWAHADELDLVVIPSPNPPHIPLATAALRAALPVVV